MCVCVCVCVCVCAVYSHYGFSLPRLKSFISLGGGKRGGGGGGLHSSETGDN